jgi:hypothetical protein
MAIPVTSDITLKKPRQESQTEALGFYDPLNG